jgi:adenosylhomocysteine nucleosidase
MPSAAENIKSDVPLSGSNPAEKIAIVAALEREVDLLVKEWRVSIHEFEGREFRFFESKRMTVVCGGIGAVAARGAAEAAISVYRPNLVVSAGFAGALEPNLRVGDVVIPRWVIDARDSSRHDTGAGEGVLLTVSQVAGIKEKEKLAQAYCANAVDMEAASVAKGAQKHGIPFLAVKVISDRMDFVMPPLERFVDNSGQFRTLSFAVYSAVRPWLWKSVIQLGRNSAAAAKALRKTLVLESLLSLAASNRRAP